MCVDKQERFYAYIKMVKIFCWNLDDDLLGFDRAVAWGRLRFLDFLPSHFAMKDHSQCKKVTC